jgi:hypothetical protein
LAALRYTVFGNVPHANNAVIEWLGPVRFTFDEYA